MTLCRKGECGEACWQGEQFAVKRRNWILLAVLVLAMFLLSGCGVPQEGVDVVNTQPEGPWQTFVVWPLANILIGIDNFLAGIGVTYYWGWAIIVFTFIVKLITFPLTLQQTRGMQAQKDLQPRLAGTAEEIWQGPREAVRRADEAVPGGRRQPVERLSALGDPDADLVWPLCSTGGGWPHARECRLLLDPRPQLSAVQHGDELDHDAVEHGRLLSRSSPT